jgi:hypothetical protein
LTGLGKVADDPFRIISGARAEAVVAHHGVGMLRHSPVQKDGVNVGDEQDAPFAGFSEGSHEVVSLRGRNGGDALDRCSDGLEFRAE